jgi:outer membrane protein assembly factor BamB
LLVTLAAFSIASPATAQQQSPEHNWGKWRGPLGTGEAPHASPPIKWSEQENIKWKIKLPGRGTSTPIVWGDKIFIQTAIATGKKVEPAGAQDAAAKETASANPSSAKTETQLAQRDSKADRDNGKRDNAKSDATKKDDAKSDSARGGDGSGRRQRGQVGQGGFGGFGGGRRGGFGRGAPPTEIHQFVLLCLDRQTGKTLWQKVASEVLPHEGHHRDHGFASHSPITDGQHVIAYFGSRGLHCYDMDGNLKWSKDLGRMQSLNGFGEGSSPTLFGSTVIVNWDHEGDDFIAAFDKATGNELWREPRNERTTWSTPLVVEHNGQAQVIIGATDSIRSYDLRSGKQLWESAGLTRNVIPSPVSAGDMVYLTSGYQGQSLKAIRLGATGDIDGTESIVWELGRGKGTPYVPSPLLYKDKLYFCANNDATLSCYDAVSGEPIAVMKRIEGLSGVYASPVAAGQQGRVYLVGRNGTTAVIKHAAEPVEEFEILSTNVLDDPIDASPAIVAGEIFLRGHEHLYCIAER